MQYVKSEKIALDAKSVRAQLERNMMIISLLKTYPEYAHDVTVLESRPSLVEDFLAERKILGDTLINEVIAAADNYAQVESAEGPDWFSHAINAATGAITTAVKKTTDTASSAGQWVDGCLQLLLRPAVPVHTGHYFITTASFSTKEAETKETPWIGQFEFNGETVQVSAEPDPYDSDKVYITLVIETPRLLSERTAFLIKHPQMQTNGVVKLLPTTDGRLRGEIAFLSSWKNFTETTNEITLDMRVISNQ